MALHLPYVRSATPAPSLDGPAAFAPARLPLVLVAYLAAVALPFQFELGSVLLSGVRTVLLIAFLPLALRLLTGRLGQVLPTDVLLLLHVIWAVAMLGLNSPDFAVSTGGAYVLELYGSYLLGRCLIRTPEQFWALCRGLFAVVLFTLPFALYETQTGYAAIPDLMSRIPGLIGYGDYNAAVDGRRLGLFRSQVIFPHPIHYGMFCASLFALAYVGTKGLVGRWRRPLLAMSVVAGAVASVSSGALLPLFAQTILIGWAWIFRSLELRWVAFTALTVVGYVVIDALSSRSGIEVLLSYGTLSSDTAFMRLHIFNWGLLSVWENPVLGIGLNDWVRPNWLASSVDNYWLLAAMRYGLPGLFLLAAGYLILVGQVALRNIGTAGVTPQFRRAWIFTQIALILTLCTVDVWETALSFVYLLLGSGAWMASANPGAADEAAASPPQAQRPGRVYSRFPADRRRPISGALADDPRRQEPPHRPLAPKP